MINNSQCQCDYCLSVIEPIVHTSKSFPRPALIAFRVIATIDGKHICETCLERICTEEHSEIKKIKELKTENERINQ